MDLTHDAAYFEHLYATAPDPWGFDTRWYEQRKYALTLAALPERRYRRALEPGCANGALTELLSERCDELIAFDRVVPAVTRAQQRLGGKQGVEVVAADFPEFWPLGTGDLVVWSEVAYYLTVEGARQALDGLDRWLEPGGILLAVHYTGTTDYPRHGRAIGPWLDDVLWLERIVTLDDESFALGAWRRATATDASVSGRRR